MSSHSFGAYQDDRWSTSNGDLAMRTPLPPSSSTLGQTSSSTDESLDEVSTPTNRESDGGSMSNEGALAPVDGGFGAWSFLAAAFVVEAIIWGFPYAFGFFLSAYLEDPQWSNQSKANSLLSLVGTLSSGFIYCSGTFLNPFFRRYPQHRRTSMWTGAALCGFSLLAASYATKVIVLVLTQGCLYGIGGALTYFPTLSYLQEWFVRRRGFANGILFAGTAVGGLILPVVIPSLIRAHGTSLTLRYLSAGTLGLYALTIPFIRPRLPEKRVHGPGRRSDSGRPWLKDWSWWFLILTNTVQGFAYFLPVIWLPSYASALGVSSSTSSIAVALLNGAAVFGRMSLGALSDYLSPWLLAFITLSLTSFVTFVLWGVAGHAVAGLLVFGAAYGLLASGFSSLYTAFVKSIAKDDLSLSVNLFGFLLFTRGLGNVLSSPISTVLLTSTQSIAHEKTGFDVDNGRYEKIIIYVGTCFAGAAMITLAGWMRERSLAGARSFIV